MQHFFSKSQAQCSGLVGNITKFWKNLQQVIKILLVYILGYKGNWKLVTKYVHIMSAWTYEYYLIWNEKDFANMIKAESW